MAEVLGLVASGLSVAQVAGSILTTSLKVKALLRDVKDAPQSLQNMLDHVELLAPILCEVTTGGDDGAGTNPPLLPATSHLQPALQKALAACQAAGEQLENLVRSLISQIDEARGGAKRKRAMVKVVLKKGTLAQYEAHLQRTIQLLTLVQNTYVIALQRTQPETIVSQLMSALAHPPQSAHGSPNIPPDRASLEPHTFPTVTERRISTRQNAKALGECLQLGFAKVTGLVRIYTPSKSKEQQRASSAQSRVLRLQVQMPTWICASVLDAIFSISYVGWDCSFNMYGYLRTDSVECYLATTAIHGDDVHAIHRLFQERRCSPMDCFVWNDGRARSLLEYALGVGAWQASRYLLDYSVDQPTKTSFGWLESDSAKNQSSLESLLRHEELNDEVRMSCLASCWDDFKSFTGLVGRLWPNDEFYTAAFEDRRLYLARALFMNPKLNPPSPAVFQHLCGSISSAESWRNTTQKVLSCISWGLGNIVWYNPDISSKWYSALRDTALQLDKASVMPRQQLRSIEGVVSSATQLFLPSTSFTDMFKTSMWKHPGYNRDVHCAKKYKIGSRLANCERAVQMWLNILHDCGTDLLEYGRQERQRFEAQEGGCEFRIYRDGRHGWPYIEGQNGLFEIRLVSIQYGKQPEDWKLWWSEPTDGLVGDFWREIEPEPLCIPGSWDEDF